MIDMLTELTQGPQLAVASVALCLVGISFLAILSRPQRGLLLLAALVPYDGLLELVPAPGIVSGWKEGLVLLTLGASVISASSRPLRSIRLPAWALMGLGLLVYAIASAAFVPYLQSVQALKIGYFYVLVTLIVLRNPFTSWDRHRLVTILMVNGVITSLYGLAQQVIGGDGLSALGYEYNVTIRTAGGILRSFSTFNQPFGFGLFVMMALLVGGSVALARPGTWRNAAFLVASPILVAGMATSIVRGAYLGLAVGILLLAIIRYRALLLLVPTALLVLMNLPAQVLGAVFSSSSLNERGTGWGQIFDEVLRNPFGIGIGSTGSVAEKVAEITGSRTAYYQPDSQYVKMLLELGVIGLWLLIALFVTGLTYALMVSRRSVDPDSALALGVAATMLAVIAASAVSTYLEIFPMDFYFWLLLGVLTCIPTPEQRSGSTRSHFALGAAVSRPTSANS